MAHLTTGLNFSSVYLLQETTKGAKLHFTRLQGPGKHFSSCGLGFEVSLLKWHEKIVNLSPTVILTGLLSLMRFLPETTPNMYLTCLLVQR